jgi:hypothetical protein
VSAQIIHNSSAIARTYIFQSRLAHLPDLLAIMFLSARSILLAAHKQRANAQEQQRSSVGNTGTLTKVLLQMAPYIF